MASYLRVRGVLRQNLLDFCQCGGRGVIDHD
jgi:hypothetical protein